MYSGLRPKTKAHVGKTYGRLKVLSVHMGNNSRSYAKCKCMCGNKCEVRTDYFRTKVIHSCGCYFKEMARINISRHNINRTDLIKVGTRIGSKTVLSRDSNGSNCTVRCDCGNVFESKFMNLKWKSMSCSMCRAYSKYKGMQFGDYTVVGTSKPNYLLCRCVCGVEKSVCTSNLKRGISKGCGCRRDKLSGIRVFLRMLEPAKVMYRSANSLSKSVRKRSRNQLQEWIFSKTRRQGLSLSKQHFELLLPIDIETDSVWPWDSQGKLIDP